MLQPVGTGWHWGGSGGTPGCDNDLWAAAGGSRRSLGGSDGTRGGDSSSTPLCQGEREAESPTTIPASLCLGMDPARQGAPWPETQGKLSSTPLNQSTRCTSSLPPVCLRSKGVSTASRCSPPPRLLSTTPSGRGLH